MRKAKTYLDAIRMGEWTLRQAFEEWPFLLLSAEFGAPVAQDMKIRDDLRQRLTDAASELQHAESMTDEDVAAAIAQSSAERVAGIERMSAMLEKVRATHLAGSCMSADHWIDRCRRLLIVRLEEEIRWQRLPTNPFIKADFVAVARNHYEQEKAMFESHTKEVTSHNETATAIRSFLAGLDHE